MASFIVYYYLLLSVIEFVVTIVRLSLPDYTVLPSCGAAKSTMNFVYQI